MAASKTSYLERHGNSWRVTVKVPDQARSIIGKTFLKQSLGTSNLTIANQLKMEVVAKFHRQIEEARRVVAPEDYDAEAMAIRARLELSPRTFLLEDEYGNEFEAIDDEAAVIETIAEEIERRKGYKAAKVFAVAASGGSTLITKHLKTFREDSGYQPKSLLDLDRAVAKLVEWLRAMNHPVTLDHVTTGVASDYLRHLIHGAQLSRASVEKYASFLRSYWRWLDEQNLLPPDNAKVWTVSVPKPKRNGHHTDEEPDGGKRPYTDAELTTLLTGLRGSIAEVALIGALTGMRIEEIYRLRVRDIQDGFFVVRTGKTKNAERRVPVHTRLKKLIERLFGISTCVSEMGLRFKESSGLV